MSGLARVVGSRRPRPVVLVSALLALSLGCGGSEDTGAPASSAAPQAAAETPSPPAGFGRNPNIVLVVIDTLRADHVGSYGYERPTTPTLDALAAEGVLFENALSASSWTRPAVASLFTSNFPSAHGAVAFGRRLSPEHRTLAERLAENGYLTVGVSANFVHVSKETGLDQGFERWKSISVETDSESGESLWEAADGEGVMHYYRPARADEVNEALLALLPDTLDRPVFLYAHYMEPHSDYAPAEAFRDRFVRTPTERFADGRVTTDDLIALAAGRDELTDAERQNAIDLYDAEIATADAGLAALLEGLEARGIEDPLVAVTSDHGEAFGEHDSWFHGITLHREVLAVPLVIREPSREHAGERREEAVSLLDVAPTLLECAGLVPTRDMKGSPLLSPQPPANARSVISELHPDPPFEQHVVPRTQRMAVQRGPWKLLFANDGSMRAYRADLDPYERQVLAGGQGGPPPALVHAVKQGFVVLERMVADAKPAAPLSEEEVWGLRALGYVGGAGEPGP